MNDTTELPFNPFRVLKQVIRGELEPGQAAQALGVTNRAVLRRIASFTKEMDLLIWAYDNIVTRQAPNKAVRTSMMSDLSTRLGLTKRHVLRMLTEYEGLKPTLYVNMVEEQRTRKANHMRMLEDLAARVLSSETTVSQLLETRQTDFTSRAGLYRAVNRLAKELDVVPSDVPLMSLTNRTRLAGRIRAYLKEKRKNEQAV